MKPLIGKRMVMETSLVADLGVSKDIEVEAARETLGKLPLEQRIAIRKAVEGEVIRGFFNLFEGQQRILLEWQKRYESLERKYQGRITQW